MGQQPNPSLPIKLKLSVLKFSLKFRLHQTNILRAAHRGEVDGRTSQYERQSISANKLRSIVTTLANQTEGGSDVRLKRFGTCGRFWQWGGWKLSYRRKLKMSKKNGEAAKTAASTDSATGYSFHRPLSTAISAKLIMLFWLHSQTKSSRKSTAALFGF